MGQRVDTGELSDGAVAQGGGIVGAQHGEGVLEAEPVDQMLVAHVLRPSRRVPHPVGPVSEHPQGAITGRERVLGHRCQQRQLHSRIDRRVRAGQRVHRHELEPAPVELVVKGGNAVEIVP